MGQMPTVRADTRTEYAALLRRPRYPSFVLTVSLARMTGAMFITSGVLLVLGRTGSAGLAGLTAAASTLPGALSGPVLGAWLDIARRRRVLIVADQVLSVAALLAILALAGQAPDWTVPTVAVLYGITRPFSTGSFVSALAEVAGPELLDRASAIEATSLNLGIVVGPALAGVLVGTIGAAPVIEIQAALTLLVAVLIAANPVFEARPATRAESMRQALREGTRVLLGHRLLRNISGASVLANFSWGLMTITFPLYAAQRLHAGANAGGYLWAALALGSILGTFLLAGTPSARRVAGSYAVLGLSALLWQLADTLIVGFLLITLTGVIDGPAYSGTIALRQRHVPAAVRGQVFNTLGSLSLGAISLGSAVGGLLHRPLTTFAVFTAVNLLAAMIAARAGGTKPPDTVRIPDTGSRRIGGAT
jgi:MFS family permease